MKWFQFKKHAAKTEEKTLTDPSIETPSIDHGEFDDKDAVLGLTAADVLADKLYRDGLDYGFFDPMDEEITTGVSVKRSSHGVTSCPFKSPMFHDFERAVEDLNVNVAFKIHTRTVESLFQKFM